MMPVMQFRRADEHPQRTDWEANVRMDVDGPDAAKGEQAGECLQRESHDESRQIDQTHGVNGVQRMLPVRRQPVEMFGALMDRMEPPEKLHSVLQPMSPISSTACNHHGCDITASRNTAGT